MASPFMKLPAEVRMMIYHCAFSGLRLWIRHVHREKGDFRASFEQSSRGLVRTSKLIRMESLPLLYHDLGISCTYRVKRKGDEAGQWVDYPFYSQPAVSALHQATTIMLDREMYTCYDSFGTMFRHCARLQQIELCVIAGKEYSQDVGHDRPWELQNALEEACEATTMNLLERCKEKIARNVRRGGAEAETDSQTSEDKTDSQTSEDKTDSQTSEDKTDSQKSEDKTDSQKSEDKTQGLAVEKVSVKAMDSLSFRGMISFKTTTRFRIRLDGN
ncbi:hypothetical protein DV737_g1438, partial [Chaetothyriales sp. CBS 132003]